MGAFLVRALTFVVTNAATRKVALNLTLELARWASERTDNDVDDKLVHQLARALDSIGGVDYVNLYGTVRKKL